MLTTGKHKKKVKEVRVNGRNYTSKNGNIYIHYVTFEDNSVGEYHSQKDTCSAFVPEQEVEFDCTVSQNGQYTNYKIKPVQAAFSGRTGGGGGIDMKLYAATECFKMAKITAKENNITNKEEIAKIAKSYFEIITGISNGQ